MTMNYKYFFTITAGRTGSAWLTSFLSQNLKINSIHEPLGIDDFGVRMPDIRLMRMFNMRGNTAEVQNFYKFKLDEISKIPNYAETNHTLAKCGLVENLANHQVAPETCIIILTRDFGKQCLSYITRGDFRNITVDWQWYLHQGYKNNIIGYAPFEKYGLLGKTLWYCYEMDARQIYYEELYSSKIKMVRAKLEEITTSEGAKKLLHECGYFAAPILPEAKNQNRQPPNFQLLEKIKEIISGINYDGEAIVRKFLKNNGRLDLSVGDQ
jgi:hypothetical protein